MRRLALSCMLLELALPSCADETLLISTPDQSLQVYALPKEIGKRLDGCSCSFSLKSKEKNKAAEIIGWRLGDDTAYMQINGATEELKLVKTLEQPKPPRKSGEKSALGDKINFVLKNTTSTVTVGCVVSTMCYDYAECEGIGYTGKLTVKSKERTLHIPVEGACGC